MLKKTIIICTLSLLIIAVITFGLYFSLHGNPIKKEEAAQKVQNHLISEKGYSNEEIDEINGMYSFTSSESPYGANVVFKDEPKTIYSYFIFNDGHIVQTGYSGNTSNHKEK